MSKILRWLLLILTALCLLACGVYVLHSRQTRDTAAPVISFAEDALSLSVHDAQDVLLDGVTAWDDRDGDVTASLVVEGVSSIHSDDSATVTYAAFDRAGNVTKAQRAVRYTDYEDPRFSLSAPLIFRSGFTVDLFRYVTASDPVDGDISDRIKATLTGGETSISEIGIHEVELRVTNSMGDTARLTVPVEVYASSDYNATVKLSDYLVYVNAGSAFAPESYLQGMTAGYREYSVSQLSDDGAKIDIRSNVRTDVPGAYDVTYTVSHGSYTGYTRLIVIVEE